jgi:hypothetical protein
MFARSTAVASIKGPRPPGLGECPYRRVMIAVLRRFESAPPCSARYSVASRLWSPMASTRRHHEHGASRLACDFTPSRVLSPIASTPPTSRSSCSTRGSPRRTTVAARHPPNTAPDGSVPPELSPPTPRTPPVCRVGSGSPDPTLPPDRQVAEGPPHRARKTDLGRALPTHTSHAKSVTAEPFPTTARTQSP